MIGRALIQAACIAAVALTIGTIDALIKPVKWWERDKPEAPVTIPAQPGPDGKPVAAAPVQPSGRDERMVTLARLKELMAGSVPIQIVDAREPAEFAAGRIAGAINIPPGEFYGKVPDLVSQRLQRDLPVVVYCGGGDCDASKLVAVRLKDLGFAQVSVFEDGYNGWTKAGEAVEK